jgi:sigma54-dependent transcription regulator
LYAQIIDTSIIEDDRKEIAKAAPETEVKDINVDVNDDVYVNA